MLSQFFIKRPIFAAVLSLLFFITGAIAVWQLPITEYPEVVPPTVVVTANYPGANPKVIAETVASPLEQEINGVEDMLYMSSQATSDGRMTLTITFAIGTDVDRAQTQVQSRVDRAMPRLPQEVQRLGIVTEKSSPDLTMVVHLLSPDNRYDMLYLSNYAALNVKDELARIKGVGAVRLFGAGEYSLRIWLDPNKVSALGLSPADIIAAVREQNQQAAAGSLGAQPSGSADFQLLINVKGRLTELSEFEDIIIKVGQNGEVNRLKDVARIELGATSYALRSLLDNKDAVAIPVFQASGSNAIQISDDVRAKMAELSKGFPEGLTYEIVYDPTVFVRGSIEAVMKTLLEAVLLVVLVVVLFLQTWRASIIPLVAVPVSLVGTFAFMHLLGFSLNALSLFGLVLAIGIVVDDAIVVVENVERNIAAGLSPVAATQKAMKEVTGPIVATTLVLAAVFIPTAFMSGLTGQFYKQFALTITISTFISAINSLTLSPALSALLLKSHDAPKDGLTRLMDKLLGGWLFTPFNRLFSRASDGYGWLVRKVIRFGGIIGLVYLGMVALTGVQFAHTPTGYVPGQDKQYLVAFAQLPDAASLERTDTVIKKMSEIALNHPGVAHSIAFPGLSINGFTNSPNSGVVFVALDDFELRKSPELSANAIAGQLNKEFAGIQDAFIAIFPPPPVQGLGTIGGFRLQIQDRANLGYEALYQVTQQVMYKAWADPQLAGIFSSYQVNVPQLELDIDRTKAKQQAVSLDQIFQTLQTYMGSTYVNDFNRFGRTYQVNMQADEAFRQSPQQISQLKVPNLNGDMIPLGSFINVSQSSGPDRVMHYNGFTTAEINGGPAAGVSTGQAQAAIEKILAETLPNGMTYEWTELTYQQILAGNTGLLVFPLVILLVFMVLAAQYESLSLPLAIILIIPMTLLSALSGVLIYGGDNNIFTQIGLIVLVGLATKNAILIVEFAKEKQDHGMAPMDAILEAARLRLRPILMTSIAFIMGVVPMVFSTGAGAEMRQAMGVAVFAGMIGVTVFGLILTPLFYYALAKRGSKKVEEHKELTVS
ncbi:multidrug efflux RND transporter permease subunit [Shewanella baltica]|jgi:multidrug efflux pump|uniref:efflux RND transporter permease subunit n=1 Tax=Shewanella TaxID=22 RepID=UPI00014F84FE|nr:MULTISPECIES: multidrug efflux RND transporter permease subunit [Shewanella]ABS09310.1 transporter, hydrophobe/amphiphile efflux-1 (HAE1) family [Shewanella baltica OS185]MCB2383190.1 efflux RND transporter permease subunit [Shewanella sp. SR1]MCS6113586.1 efflux RND transporter permease subunit [Shewanella baltica]MCS6229457.1 efflux RND transporter permease subunit [Shewanella baltica]MDR9765911.1 multidrug efflux RND transporter permease subunit [Shewanella baltica]